MKILRELCNAVISISRLVHTLELKTLSIFGFNTHYGLTFLVEVPVLVGIVAIVLVVVVVKPTVVSVVLGSGSDGHMIIN